MLSPDETSHLASTIQLVIELSGVGLLLVAYLDYRSRNKRDALLNSEAHDAEVKRQTEMHQENRHRLETLAQFHEEQKERNQKLDEQIAQLATISTRMVQLADGQERRIRMLEDRK